MRREDHAAGKGENLSSKRIGEPHPNVWGAPACAGALLPIMTHSFRRRGPAATAAIRAKLPITALG